MAYSGNNKRIMRVMITDSTISPIEGGSEDVREGFVLCRELITGDTGIIQNQKVPRNAVGNLIWRVLIPHDLVQQGSQVAQPSPAYKNGQILYVARLDAPVVIDNSTGLKPNDHPSLDGLVGNVQLVPHKASMASHYSKTSISPANDCVFWVDLNVDGRTRGGGSGGGGGSVSVVWL